MFHFFPLTYSAKCLEYVRRRLFLFLLLLFVQLTSEVENESKKQTNERMHFNLEEIDHCRH